MVELDRNEKGIDIHHIFPKKSCIGEGVQPKVFDSIVNKTAISYKANIKIGGAAPSEYLQNLQSTKAVQLDDRGMNAILRSHCIEPKFLCEDDFDGFYESRKASLLNLIETAMSKKSLTGENGNGYEEEGEDDEN